MMDAMLVGWMAPLGGCGSPQTMEMRRRQINGLQDGEVIWVCYVDYAWDEDIHQLAWVR